MLDRKTLIEDISAQACEGADLKDLIAFYYDAQVEWAESLSDEDLLEFANGYLCEFDEEDYIIEGT